MDSLANSSIVTNDNDNAHVEDVTVNAIARAEDGDNNTTAINVDGMSEDYEEESNSNGKKATKKPTSSLKQKKLVKEKLPKKGKPALNPKLQSVKNLVEAQPTTILQSKLLH
jgi:ERCC4-related helicase